MFWILDSGDENNNSTSDVERERDPSKPKFDTTNSMVNMIMGASTVQRQTIPEYNVTSLPGNLLPLLEILYISLNTVTLSRAKLIVQLLMTTSVGCFSYLNFEIKVISLDHLVSE